MKQFLTISPKWREVRNIWRPVEQRAQSKQRNGWESIMRTAVLWWQPWMQVLGFGHRLMDTTRR